MNDEMRNILRMEISNLFEKYGRENVDEFVDLVTTFLELETGYTIDHW